MTERRILVAFKVTPDFEAVPESAWAAAAADGVDLRYVRRVLNCFDESALELALRLRAEWGGPGVPAELGALSVAGGEAEPTLKNLMALGYERATRIDPGADLDVAPEVTAALLAAAVRRSAADVLLTGARCGPGDSGLVPFLVAAALGWPCLGEVVALAGLPDGRLRVTWAVAGGLVSGVVRPPCVLAVGNAVVAHLRVPTLRDRLAQQGRAPAALTPADLGVDVGHEAARATRVLEGLEPVDRSRPGVLIEGATARDKARALYEGYLLGRLTSAGPPPAPRPAAAPVVATGAGRGRGALRVFAVMDATGAGADAGRQARALAGFLGSGLGGVSADVLASAQTVLLCDEHSDARRLAAAAPTRALRVLRSAGRTPDAIVTALAGLIAAESEEALVVFPPGPAGAELAVRVATSAGGSLLSGALAAAFDAEGRLQARARVYSGHLVGRFALEASPWCLAVAASWQDEPVAAAAEHDLLEETPPPSGSDLRAAWLDEVTVTPAASSDDLAGARLLVAVGQGAGGSEGVSRLASAAARMGAVVGASRPVVMNAWAPMDRLIGVSGTRVAPDVCIAAGASGAPAFLWGIERAAFLVAVNTDPQAPLMRAADVAVVDDAVAVLEALAEISAAPRRTP